MPKLTIQKLANLLMYGWEVQQRVINYSKSPQEFKDFVRTASASDLSIFLENLGLLLRSIEELGQCQVELTAEGCPSLFAPLTNTASSIRADTAEAVLSPAIIQAIEDAVNQRVSGESTAARW